MVVVLQKQQQAPTKPNNQPTETAELPPNPSIRLLARELSRYVVGPSAIFSDTTREMKRLGDGLQGNTTPRSSNHTSLNDRQLNEYVERISKAKTLLQLSDETGFVKDAVNIYGSLLGYCELAKDTSYTKELVPDIEGEVGKLKSYQDYSSDYRKRDTYQKIHSSFGLTVNHEKLFSLPGKGQIKSFDYHVAELTKHSNTLLNDIHRNKSSNVLDTHVQKIDDTSHALTQLIFGSGKSGFLIGF
jgi:hypothetical protein